jgi:hypothetical protein
MYHANMLLAAIFTLTWRACELILAFKRALFLKYDLQYGCIEPRCSRASTHRTGLLIVYGLVGVNHYFELTP